MILRNPSPPPKKKERPWQDPRKGGGRKKENSGCARQKAAAKADESAQGPGEGQDAVFARRHGPAFRSSGCGDEVLGASFLRSYTWLGIIIGSRTEPLLRPAPSSTVPRRQTQTETAGGKKITQRVNPSHYHYNLYYIWNIYIYPQRI